MPFFQNSALCEKNYLRRQGLVRLRYQLYACVNFFSRALILEKIAILGQPPMENNMDSWPAVWFKRHGASYINQLTIVKRQIVVNNQYKLTIKKHDKRSQVQCFRVQG